MAPEILIVADDVSGAADCAVPFAVRGFHTVVVLDSSESADAEVLAIDSGTRQQSAERAAAETERIVRKHAGVPWCLKKIDSTLRGHVGAEVAAALRARRSMDRRAALIVAPAFPAMGRTTVDGHQHVHGVPLETTDLWARDRVSAEANVGRILETAGLTTWPLTLEDVRLGDEKLRDRLGSAARQRDAVVCDAETEDDLRAIAIAAASLGTSMVWVGTAGLSHHMAIAISVTPATPVVTEAMPGGSILFVVGSPSAVSIEQVAALGAEPGIVVLDGADAATVTAQLRAGRDVVARPANPTAAAALAPAAEIAAGLVLTGGETAHALLGALGVRSIRLVREVERGVPLATSDNGRLQPIVLKAGAFGNRQTLIRCRQVLRGLARGPAE